MDAVVASGLFALGGVAGGVLLGGLVTAVNERRAERRAAAIREGERVRALRAAARLVVMELDETRVEAVWAEREKRWWHRPRLPTSLWREHRGLLAVELPTEEWRLVDAAYYNVAALNRVRSLAGPEATEITRLGLEVLSGGTEARLRLAIEALSKYAGAEAT